jgi:hypothetical protein
MSERTWERYGAATGIAFGILLLVAVFIVPTPPHVDASASKIAAYYGDHRQAVLASGVIGALSGVAALLFICHLRHIFDRVEGGIEGMSTIVLATGLAAVAVSAVSGIVQTTMSFMSVQPGGLGDAGLVRALYDVAYVGNGVTLMFAAAWLASVGVGMVRGEAATPALGWFAVLVAATSLVGSVGLLTVSSYSAAWMGISIAAIVGVGLWSVVGGALMMRRPAVEAMSSHRSLIATTS